MANRYTKRQIRLLSIASSTSQGAGPYEDVFLNMRQSAPYETEGDFSRKLRVTRVQKFGGVRLVELYLLLGQVDILEVSASPDVGEAPRFLVPPSRKSFAYRTCAIFDGVSKTCALEYVKSGPKAFDFEVILTEKLYELTKDRSAQFALRPIIEENFIKEINQLERIRQVRVVFKRPNPGWGDIGVLAKELDDSGDAKREVALTAPRKGSISKNKGLLRFVKSTIQTSHGESSISNVVVTGTKPGDAGETHVSSERSEARRVASVPITDDEATYRNHIVQVASPMLAEARQATPRQSR